MGPQDAIGRCRGRSYARARSGSWAELQQFKMEALKMLFTIPGLCSRHPICRLNKRSRAMRPAESA